MKLVVLATKLKDKTNRTIKAMCFRTRDHDPLVDQSVDQNTCRFGVINRKKSTANYGAKPFEPALAVLLIQLII